MCGYVMQITDCTKVKYVDGRKKSQGTKLSKIVQENDAIAGINAGGFADPEYIKCTSNYEPKIIVWK